MSDNARKSGFFSKVVILTIVGAIGYFGYGYYKNEVRKNHSKQELGKFDNIESDIFDLSDNSISADSGSYAKLDEHKLSELTITELREGGAEFIYQLLLYNQVQIAGLKSSMQILKEDFKKYKSQEKIAKMTLVYVDLRQKIYQGKNYTKSLQSFEILASGDKKLEEKIDNLKINLQNFYSFDVLSVHFSKIIPSLIATKNHNFEGSFSEKLRFSFAKIITIRKLDENGADIDGAIVRIEKSLRDEDCQNALLIANSAEGKYKKILETFIAELNFSCEVKKSDEGILLYLESLAL